MAAAVILTTQHNATLALGTLPQAHGWSCWSGLTLSGTELQSLSFAWRQKWHAHLAARAQKTVADESAREHAN